MSKKQEKSRLRPETRPPEPAPHDDELLWGLNAVWEALEAGSRGISEIFIQQGKAGPRLQQIIDRARESAIPVRFVDASRMRVPRTCKHQGVVARQAEVQLLSWANLLDELEEQGAVAKILALDSIQDPRNLGSILRSALAAGFTKIILTKERSAPVTGTVARTSAGAIAHLQIYTVTNLAESLKQLKDKGFWVFGAVAEKEATSCYDSDFSGQVCLVIGSEGKGIRPLVRKQCDILVTIPMQATFNSLNASVAAAILMFEITRRSL